jgi:anti-anti-sigma factor
MSTPAATTVTYEDIGDTLRRIVISGRLDNIGTTEMAAGLADAIAEPKRGVIVDLTGVAFLASVGIGQLIATAQEIKGRGGFMVLLCMGSSSVMTSLKMASIDTLIPVFDNPSLAYSSALRGF